MDLLSQRFISEWGGVGTRVLGIVSLYLRDCEMFHIVGGVNRNSRGAVVTIYRDRIIERPMIYFKNKYIQTENGENIFNVYSRKWSIHKDNESLRYAVMKKNTFMIRDIVDCVWGWRKVQRTDVWERNSRLYI